MRSAALPRFSSKIPGFISYVLLRTENPMKSQPCFLKARLCRAFKKQGWDFIGFVFLNIPLHCNVGLLFACSPAFPIILLICSSWRVLAQNRICPPSSVLSASARSPGERNGQIAGMR